MCALIEDMTTSRLVTVALGIAALLMLTLASPVAPAHGKGLHAYSQSIADLLNQIPGVHAHT